MTPPSRPEPDPVLSERVDHLRDAVDGIQAEASKRYGRINAEIESLRAELKTGLSRLMDARYTRAWLAPSVLIVITLSSISGGFFFGNRAMAAEIRAELAQQDRQFREALAQLDRDRRSIEVDLARVMEQILRVGDQIAGHSSLPVHPGAVPRVELDSRLQDIQRSVLEIERLLMDGPPLPEE